MDGTTLITDKTVILNRWAEHVSAVLNRPGDINAEANVRLAQTKTNTDLDRPPSEEEVKKAITNNSLLEKSKAQMPSLPKFTSMVVTF